MVTDRPNPDGAYGTHITPLIVAFLNTLNLPGPVLELGMGDFSTPVLHELAQHHGKELISVEGDHAWMQNFKDLEMPGHQMMYYPVFKSLKLQQYALILIDHAPGNLRVKDIEALRNHASVLVVHDTEKGKHYGYEPTISTFKYRYDYPRYRKQTTLLSDTVDVRRFFDRVL